METIKIPSAQLEQLRRVTGKRTAAAAVRAAIKETIESREPPLSSLPPAVRESEREFRTGKGKRFGSSKAAIKWLQSRTK